jgi:diacylglycerol kinase (ATP)
MRLLRYEHSAWIQLSIAAVAVVLAIALQISASDWRWIVVACGMVLSVEGLNTAVEATCDRISVAYSEQIKLAKDVAAGAVLLSSIAAAVIGVLTFWPYLFADNPVAGPMVWSSSQPFNPSAYHCIAGTGV